MATMTKAQKADQVDSRNALRDVFLKHADGTNPTEDHPKRIRGEVTHVARSGMMRRVRLYVAGIDDRGEPEIYDITYHAARAIGWPMNDQGIRVDGCGMDMVFHLTYVLGATLYEGPRSGYALKDNREAIDNAIGRVLA